MRTNYKKLILLSLVFILALMIWPNHSLLAQTQQETQSTNVSLSIQPHLTFAVNGVNQGDPCSNSGGLGNAEAASTAGAINFGTFNSADRVLACQQTVVSTNSTNGYWITIQQDHDLNTVGGDFIEKFYGSSGTADTWAAPEVWASPVTPHHAYFGFTTSDTTDFPQFIPSRYAGFQADNTEYQIITAPGPVADDTEYITFQVQFDNLIESGLYNNTVTYIATATF